jgi:NADH-quinone oxidoreductase subunit M
VTLHLPWLELSIAIPLVGAAWVSRVRDPEWARRKALVFFVLTLLCAIGAWLDFGTLHTFEAHDRWDVLSSHLSDEAIVVDELSAPLLPLTALIFLLTAAVTLRTKVRRFSFAGTLVSEGILLATLSCKAPWGVIALLALGTVPPYVELLRRRKPTRVYLLHMGLFIGLMVAGYGLVSWEGDREVHSALAVGLLLAAALVRSGIVPLHCWMTDLFEHASFGTALLFVTPMAGAYAAMRLVLPIAPDWALRSIAIMSLVTAVYAAGMAVVQREARRFFCYLFLSHSSLVLVGLETATPVALTGALCVWLSVGLALTGFGLTLRSMEARTGRLSLDGFHGLYEHTPSLAVFFLLTGLASVGFPGSFGFVGSDLLVSGVVEVYPLMGTAVVIAAALNGIAVLQAYFRVFTGARHKTSISLRRRPSEQFAILTLAFLILAGGLFPQPGIASRYHAAMQVVRSRHVLTDDRNAPHASSHTVWGMSDDETTAAATPAATSRSSIEVPHSLLTIPTPSSVHVDRIR